MAIRTKQRQRRTFTLPTNILAWIDSKAKENKISRSELINRLLHKYFQEERQKKMIEGYKAFGDILKNTAQASLSSQKKVIPDY
ncbi:MAG: hypothetical protein U9O41_03705 [Candidatus Aerophobetes bacterium]|nr:hypothetical protein [Candidatus Aerophobetes bacterium]